jgi:cytochrome c biogenesis protein ResB
VPEGATGSAGGMEFNFEGVVGVPSQVESGIPGAQDAALVEMAMDAQGAPYLTVLGVAPDKALTLYPDKPVVVGENEYTFLGRREFSGITVRRDPGTKFIWVAAGLLLVGLSLTFYVPRRRLWAKITRDRTYFAGQGRRTGRFEAEMKKIAGDD